MKLTFIFFLKNNLLKLILRKKNSNYCINTDNYNQIIFSNVFQSPTARAHDAHSLRILRDSNRNRFFVKMERERNRERIDIDNLITTKVSFTSQERSHEISQFSVFFFPVLWGFGVQCAWCLRVLCIPIVSPIFFFLIEI